MVIIKIYEPAVLVVLLARLSLLAARTRQSLSCVLQFVQLLWPWLDLFWRSHLIFFEWQTTQTSSARLRLVWGAVKCIQLRSDMVEFSSTYLDIKRQRGDEEVARLMLMLILMLSFIYKFKGQVLTVAMGRYIIIWGNVTLLASPHRSTPN